MTAPMVVRIGFDLTEAGSERLEVSLEEPVVDGAHELPYTGREPELAALANRPPGSGSVRAAGRLLYDALAAHPAIQDELAHSVRPTGGPRPLYLELREGGRAEGVPWESLCTPNGDFLALDPRWPVSRLVHPVDRVAGVRAFRPPLRVALVLSCLGIPAADEWRRIWAVLAAAPFAVEVLALVSEVTLHGEIAALGDPRITLAGVPADIPALTQRVASFQPDVLHFFCHGSLEGGAHLEVAVANDWVTGAAVGSLLLEPHQVSQLSSPERRAWLAVLNCCEVGAPSGTTHSLARDLVSKGPFAAALAMREPIRPADAASVSGGLYPGLVEAVRRVVDAGGSRTEIDWGALVVEPRRRLCADHQDGGLFTQAAASTTEWTLPVLYVRHPLPFEASLETRAITPAAALELELLRRIRAGFQPSTPATFRAEVEARIAHLDGGGT